jgi:hypothetical protein
MNRACVRLKTLEPEYYCHLAVYMMPEFVDDGFMTVES